MGDWPSSVEAWRIAQILVQRAGIPDHPGQPDDLAGKPSGRGSGYLVAPGRVLTAAHVLDHAAPDNSSVTVLLDVGQPGQIRIQIRPEDCWTDTTHDLAVITIPDTAHGDRP